MLIIIILIKSTNENLRELLLSQDIDESLLSKKLEYIY